MSLGARLGWVLGGIAALAVAGILAFGAAVSVLKGKIGEALGPRSETSAIHVGISGVIVEGLRVPAVSGWPTEDGIRAERVSVVPTLRSLISGDPYRILSVTLTRPYLSALRGRDGKLSLPRLRDDSAAAEPSALAPLRIRIGEIALEDAVFESFDARVATPPAKVRLEQIDASIHDVQIPSGGGRSRMELDGVGKGATQDGQIHVTGWIDLDTRDSSIETELRSVDLVPFQHYLVREGEGGIRAGRFDLDLQSEVRAGQLRAPGRLRLIGLELESGRDAKSTFMGISRRAMLAALDDSGGTIDVAFTLEGDVDSPEFSLNEALSAKLAYGIAETLGVSLGGLVKGVGTVGVKSGQVAGEAVKDVGGAVLDLFKEKPGR